MNSTTEAVVVVTGMVQHRTGLSGFVWSSAKGGKETVRL